VKALTLLYITVPYIGYSTKENYGGSTTLHDYSARGDDFISHRPHPLLGDRRRFDAPDLWSRINMCI
jgi:hypothetical protein